MKVFFDTHVLVSALATRGLCTEIFEAVIDSHTLLTSEAVLVELDRTLARKFRLPRAVIDAYLAFLREQAQVVVATLAPVREVPDPVDGAIVACAVAAGADVFVTGDQAVRNVGSTAGMPIKSPREFWLVLAELKDA